MRLLVLLLLFFSVCGCDSPSMTDAGDEVKTPECLDIKAVVYTIEYDGKRYYIYRTKKRKNAGSTETVLKVEDISNS